MGKPEPPPKQAVAVLIHQSPGRAEAQQCLREAQLGSWKNSPVWASFFRYLLSGSRDNVKFCVQPRESF